MAGSGLNGPTAEAARRWLLEQATRAGANRRWPFYILLGLSWLSTTSGLMTLIQASRGDAVFEWIPVSLLVLAMTMVMKDFVEQVFDRIDLRQKIVAFVGYMFLMLVSVFFSFGFYWGLMEAPRQQLGNASREVGSILVQVQAAEADLARVTTTMDGLREASSRQSLREQQVGDTCGTQTLAVCGPRCQFRAAEAVRFGEDAARLSAEAAILTEQLSRMTGEAPRSASTEATAPDAAEAAESSPTLPAEQATDETAAIPTLRRLQREGVSGRADEERRAREFERIEVQLNSFVARYNAFQGSLPSTARSYQQLAQKYRSEALEFQHRGATFACTDPGFAGQLDGVTSQLNRIPPMERIIIPPPGAAAGTIEAFRRLTTSLVHVLTFRFLSNPSDELTEEEAVAQRMRAQQELDRVQAGEPPISEPLPGQEEVAEEGLQSSDTLPLIPAIAVDILILLLGMSRAPATGLTRAAAAMKGAQNAALTMPGLAEQLRARVEDPNFMMLEHYTIKYLGRRYLAIPHQIETSEDRVMANLAEVLAEDGRAQRNANPMWFGANEIRRRLAAANSPIQTREGDFDLYRLAPSATLQTLFEFLAHTHNDPPVDI